ncbi:CPBP family intramembrane glutamic endopeptidase [Paenibacillus sp. J2TS4]|uniref:CPBP family intramembrane glutamic endopeptidase n=1 Tax=Paenibacillus sp. J2TS4 TaxID=2807194 RepID=UPI001B029AEA|nr:type II CAAX endopeptidase family protein [Paenibacillus sp. J2TS4]GIP31653.1 CAAX amino protease [Paenibacillus sp. J2TS4]
MNEIMRDVKHAPAGWAPLILYYIVFAAGWAVCRIWLLPPGMPSLSWGLVEAAVKTFVWVVPVCVYIIAVIGESPVTYLRWNRKIGSWGWTVIPIIIWAVYTFIVDHIVFSQPFTVTRNLSVWLNVVLLAGVLEETVFRGFLLRQLAERLPFAGANLLTGALFILIHVPIWMSGDMAWLDMLWRATDMLLFSLVAGYMWLRTGSLWAPVLFHTANNLFIHLGL